MLRGERTFGKGLVQAVYGLADGQGLILTVAQYETPRGAYIHVRPTLAFAVKLLHTLLLLLFPLLLLADGGAEVFFFRRVMS